MNSARSVSGAAVVVALLLVAACGDRAPTDPGTGAVSVAPSLGASSGRRATADEVRRLAVEHGIGPMPRAPRVRGSLSRLGRLLVFDKELSGNRDISCMTCHLPALATGDGRSLAIGQGATGTGADRVHPQGRFIPRNAPPLFNLHLVDHLFWDGRVFVDGFGNLHTPAGAAVTREMRSVMTYGAVSAVGLFPVLSRAEMRGETGENELADMDDGEPGTVWAGVMRRLGAKPAYRRMFEAAYPGTTFDEMNFAYASNAMGAFLLDAFVFDNSPWDRFLAGSDAALTDEQLQGALAFMNAPCASCHDGPGFSDDEFHNVALAQFGPGEGDGPSGHDDFGRERVTGHPADRYRFRTTMLRNVELTGPYGHAGQFAELDRFIDHYSENADKLQAYSADDVPEPLLRGTLLTDNVDAILDARDPLILPAVFDESTVRLLAAYMSALTDARARSLERLVPRSVPSGLSVDR